MKPELKKTNVEKNTPQPKTTQKMGLRVLLTFVILIVLILAILPLFINPIADSLIRQQVTALFGNKLKMGTVNISFLLGPTVSVNQVELKQPPGYRSGDLIKADSIQVRVALMPLFKKQLLIREIAIIRPEIHIIQYQNGRMNVDYYLAKFAAEPGGSSEPGLTVHLNQFKLKNSKIILNSYAMSIHQPTLVLTDCNLSMNDLELPNLNKIATRFSFSGQLGTTHPAPFYLDGTGVFGANTISFAAKSRVQHITLRDYAYLMPPSSYTITSGKAWIISDAKCNNNYLRSRHHVELKNLSLKASKGHALDGTLLGVPGNIFIKFIEDEKGAFSFDYSLSGRLDDLKANLRFQVIEAVTKGIQAKIGYGFSHSVGKATSGVKKLGTNLFNSFKGIFKRKK